MRRALLFAAGVAIGVAAPTAARADTPEERRARIEDLFLQERFAEVEMLSVGEHQEPRLVLEEYWRPKGGDTVFFGTGAPPLLDRRMAWFGSSGPYPQPAPGETDPYPRITALVLERQRRETLGARGLPSESPLAALHDPNVDWFLANVQRRAFLGPDPAAATPTDREIDRRVDEVVARNRWIALAAVLGLLAVAGVGLLLARRPAS
jgi:hypothetical protein